MEIHLIFRSATLIKTQWHSTQFQRWWHPQTHHLSVNTPFFGIASSHAWCTNLCSHLCGQSYILRGKCSHVWTCVGWCKWTCAQVGDTHLPGATTFLKLAGSTQVHQPLQSLTPTNDVQVWGLEHICEVVLANASLVQRFFDLISQLGPWCI